MNHDTNIVVVQLLSHVQLCDLKDCYVPGFPVLHYLWEFPQTRIYWAGDANDTNKYAN